MHFWHFACTIDKRSAHAPAQFQLKGWNYAKTTLDLRNVRGLNRIGDGRYLDRHFARRAMRQS